MIEESQNQQILFILEKAEYTRNVLLNLLHVSDGLVRLWVILNTCTIRDKYWNSANFFPCSSKTIYLAMTAKMNGAIIWQRWSRARIAKNTKLDASCSYC